ncbi:MAG TPA: hypothetical protein VGJ20_29930 [Xanthobacteraceae bacterium]|jgi:hypothetical protein
MGRGFRDHAIASVEHANLAVLDAVDGRTRDSSSFTRRDSIVGGALQRG